MSAPYSVNYLIVAGGGGGVVSGTTSVTPTTAYTVTIGAGMSLFI